MADINTRVAQYVKLRDHIKKLNADHKKTMEPFNATLEQLNSVLLSHLNTMGANSASTDGGTVYRTEKKTAGLADAKAFMDYVIANQAWDLLDRKANVTAVEDHINTNQIPPPGVNFTSTFVVGVRRA